MGAKRTERAGQVTPSENEIREELAPDGVIDPEDLKREGAWNEEAVVNNRRQAASVAQKRAGKPGISWGFSHACELFDAITEVHASSTMYIQVERVTGPVQGLSWYLSGEPRNGAELYQQISAQCHKRSDEAKYKVTFKDRTAKNYRGVGWLTLPSTLGAESIPAALAAPPPAPAPMPFAPAPTFPQGADSGVVGQLLQQMQAMQQQILSLAQQRPGAPPTAPAAPAAAPAFPVAAPPGAPPPPPGSVLYVQGVGWVQVAGEQKPPPPPPPTQQPAATAAAPASAADQYRAALGQVSEAIAITREASKLVPGMAPAAKVETPAAPPITTYDLGKYKLIQNTDDGSLRPIETIIANIEEIGKWVSSEREKWTKAHAEQAKATTAMQQREAELAAAHQRIIDERAAMARGEIPPAPAPQPQQPPTPPAHVNGASNGAAAKPRASRMTPPTVPGAR